MKTFILIYLLGLSSLCVGQMISPVVISSGSTELTDGEYILDITVGETAISTHMSANNTMTLGFHQVLDVITSTNDISKTPIVRVFPNPARDNINIQLDEEADIKWKLVDVKGIVLFEGTQKMLNIQSLASGMYFLRLHVEGYRPMTYGVVVY